jgi:hypothetical protein
MRCSNHALKGLLNMLQPYGEPPAGSVPAALMDLREARELIQAVLDCEKCKSTGLCRFHRGRLGRQTWERSGMNP